MQLRLREQRNGWREEAFLNEWKTFQVPVEFKKKKNAGKLKRTYLLDKWNEPDLDR